MKLVIRSLKTTLLVDTQAQTVLDVHVTTTRKHDTQIGPQLTERNLEQFEVRTRATMTRFTGTGCAPGESGR